MGMGNFLNAMIAYFSKSNIQLEKCFQVFT